MSFNKNEVTKEMIERAMQCKTAEELVELAKTAGYPMTIEEGEAYMAELADFELDGEALKQVAGGICYMATCDDHSGPTRPHALT